MGYWQPSGAVLIPLFGAESANKSRTANTDADIYWRALLRGLKVGKLNKERNGMKACRHRFGRGGSRPRLRGVTFLLGIMATLLSGCSADRSHVDRALMAERGTAGRNEGVAGRYKIGCPDILELTMSGLSAPNARLPVNPDGRIQLGQGRVLLVEGRTPEEVASLVAARLALPVDQVAIRVGEFKSKEIYISGPGIGIPRTVPYRGPETVLDVLQRVGGIAPSAAPEEVYVVRSHIADGDRPEVFHVELRAILLKKDDKTNVRLEPFDHIHVGETRQGKTDKCLPPWLRPFHQAIWGIEPQGANSGHE
jgi:protein involved in polysaccharide export with SLBB domain